MTGSRSEKSTVDGHPTESIPDIRLEADNGQPGSPLILRLEAQTEPASGPRSPLRWEAIALPSQEGGAPRTSLHRWVGAGWVGVCTSSVLFGPGCVVNLAR